MQRLILTSLGTCLISFLLAGAHAGAEPTRVELAADSADFAIHPQTGDVAVLDTDGGQAALLRQADLREGRGKPAAQVRVGSSPSSVCFKRYKDQALFAVVCEQDSHMYLIDAAEFTLVKKVSLASAGVTHVAASKNPDDPFVYYNFGSGHDSACGAVSLRDQKDRGAVFDRAMDSAFSADGLIAYRRGPWSPSGFESLICTSGLDADKPSFARLFYDHNSTAAYVPDPHGRYTAAGEKVYARTLEKLVATLDFTPLCFSRSKPLVFGTSNTERFPHPFMPLKNIVLRAASYNTLSAVGEKVPLKLNPPGADGRFAQGAPSPADLKRLRQTPRLFADDAHEQVVLGYRRELVLVPYADFDPPEEPLLTARLEGPEVLEVGRRYELRLVPADERAELSLTDAPEGVERDGDRLTWTPGDEQAGEATFRVTAAHGDIQTTLQLTRMVVYPHVRLPFAAGEMATSRDGRLAVVWNAPNSGALHAGFRRADQPPPAQRVAVVDLEKREVLAERELDGARPSVSLVGSYVVLTQADEPLRVEVLSAEDLGRKKTIHTISPVQGVEPLAGQLVVRTSEGVEVFDGQSLERIKRLVGSPAKVTEQGVLVQGVLWDAKLERRLIVEAGGLPALPGAEPNWAARHLAGEVSGPQRPASLPPQPFIRSGASEVNSLAVPGTATRATLRLTPVNQTVPNSTHTWRRLDLLTLTLSGETDRRVVLSRATHYSQTAHVPGATQPTLKAVSGRALVLSGDYLYQVDVPKVAGADGEPQDDDELRFAFEQTAFWVGGDGETTLRHATRGGTPGDTEGDGHLLRFELLSDVEGLSLDETTGTVTADGPALRGEAVKALEGSLGIALLRGAGGSARERLRQWQSATAEAAERLTGREPEGVPVAVPVRLKAEDAGGREATLQYYVLVDVPTEEVARRLEALAAERERQMAAARERQAAGEGATAGTPAEAAELRKKVAALEQRVDLLTRQLNEVLKKLDRLEQREER